MNDLVWYVLGVLDGREGSGSRGNRCCCAFVAIMVLLAVAGGIIFLGSR